MTSPDELAGQPEKCPKCEAVSLIPRTARPGPIRGAGTFSPVMNITTPRVNRAKRFSIAGIIVALVACLTLWAPIPYLPTFLLALTGFALIGLSYAASRRSWKRDMTLPVIGVVLSGVAFYFSVFSGGGETVEAPGPQEPEPVPVVTPPPAPAPIVVTPRPAPPSPPALLAIGQGRQWDNRTLKVIAVKIDNIPLRTVTGESASQDKFLMITIEASNTSAVPSRRISYNTLRGSASSTVRNYASLSNAQDVFYRRVDFGPDTYPALGIARSTALDPGQTVRDVLVFERPPTSAGPYRLELPLGNLGGEGVASWTIPESALR
jgi:hypothetical protein